MSVSRPSFTESEYFVPEDGNWHLKEGAPEDVKKEFEEYIKTEKKLEEQGIET